MAGIKTFPQSPYFDDYDSSKDYLQVLFRPAVGVQVREINQLQTIAQNQLGRLADSFYENGARIVRGEVSVDNAFPFVKVSANVARAVGQYVGRTIQNADGTKAKIIKVVLAEGADPCTIYVQYIYSGATTSVFGAGTLTITHSDATTENVTATAVGVGTLFSIDSGVYYISGRFVNVSADSIVLSKYTSVTTGEIGVGFLVDHQIVTNSTDASLVDNSTGTPNSNAPGAHRYKIALTLTVKPSADADILRYVEVARVINGKIAAKVVEGEYTTYNKLLADRTSDESGDYVIEDFMMTVDEHLRTSTTPGIYDAGAGGDATKLVYSVDPGRAYVKGYPVETYANTYLSVPKARTTASTTDGVIALTYESYITCQPTGTSIGLAIGDIVTLFASATPIGTAIVRGVTVDPTNPLFIRIDVAGFQITATGVITTLQTTGGFTASYVSSTVSGKNSKAIFKTPEPFTKTVTDASYAYNFFSQVTNSGNNVTVTSSDTLSANLSDYTLVFVKAGVTTAVAPTSMAYTTNSVVLTYSGGITGTVTVTVHGKATRTFSSIRSKTVTTVTNQAVTLTNNTLTLPNTDIIKITSVRQGSTTGPLVDSSFVFDNGQRDTFYDFGKLTGKTTMTAGTYYVTYDYYAHGAGDFFSSQSYAAGYDTIPTYTTSAGEAIFLGSALDFRISRATPSTNWVSGMATMFASNAIMLVDFEYYLSRRDIVTIDSFGNLQAIQGSPALVPSSPKVPDNTLALYEILVNPYTFNSNDVTVKKFTSRRYTMKDIGLLERRIETLEYYTSLNQAEKDLIDKNYANTFKSGFVVDNFSSQNVADESSRELSVAFDLTNREIRPEAPTKFIPFTASSQSSVVTKSNLLMLNYTEVAAISQLVCSDVERIQPYISFNWDGNIVLAPASDSWVNTQYLPDFVFDGGTLNVTTGQRFAAGTAYDTLFDVISAAGQRIATNNITVGTNNINTVTSIVGSTTNLAGDVLRSVGAVAYMRGRTITITGSGFKPNTRLYVSFDGVSVDQFCTNTGGGVVKTTGAGLVDFTFKIPDTGNIIFKTGSRTLYVSDQPVGSNNAASTEGSAIYTAEGLIEYRQRVFEQTRRVASVVTTTRRDPLAQSFFVPYAQGMFVSSVDIFFGPDAATNEFPATLEIRNMVNGYPGTEVASRVVLQANQLNASANGFTPTRFTLPYPVFLNGNTEYVFVVKTDSQTLTIWTSVLGNRSYRSIDTTTATGEIITKQPYLGSMFRSQNDTTWTAEQTRDVKFVLNRADFVTNGSVTMVNSMPAFEPRANAYLTQLSNPFTFVQGSPTATVVHPNHGFKTADTVVFSRDETTPTSYAGVPTTAIFGPALPVTVLTPDSYTVTFTGNNATSGIVTGGTVFATSRVAYATAVVSVDSVQVKGTNIAYTLSTKDYTSGTQSGNISRTANSLISFNNLQVSANSSDNSVVAIATLTTDTSLLSPVIDMEKAGLIAANNRVDNASLSQYVQKPVELTTPANRLTVYMSANVPAEANLEVWYRTGQDSISGEWKQITTPTRSGKTTSSSDFIEWEYNATTTADFYKVQVKVVLKTSNPARVPRIKSVRSICVKSV
jgi:hypothetical protein